MHKLVRGVVHRLSATYHPERIVLFGSYASGRQTQDSDLDLLIIKKTQQSFHHRLFKVRRLVEPTLKGHPFDPIVLTPLELRRRLARGDQFIESILRKGRQVYARS